MAAIIKSSSALILAVVGVFAAHIQVAKPTGGGDRILWKPPAWNFLREVPKATVSKEILPTLRVSGLPITLEETEIADVRTRLGGTIGKAGDASEFLEWVCFYGNDSKGRWVLWLESGEIDGGTVGGFQWQRIAVGEVPDGRCRLTPGTGVELPIALRLGNSEMDVLKTLGAPTVRHGERLIFVHEHQEIIRGEPYDSTNIVAILLRDGMVWAIEVSKTTSS